MNSGTDTHPIYRRYKRDEAALHLINDVHLQKHFHGRTSVRKRILFLVLLNYSIHKLRVHHKANPFYFDEQEDKKKLGNFKRTFHEKRGKEKRITQQHNVSMKKWEQWNWSVLLASIFKIEQKENCHLKKISIERK